VEFTDAYEETPEFDLSPYRQGDTLVSATGQLRWRFGAKKLDGAIAIDTAATKAVVGFAEGRTYELGEVTIAPQSRFAAIYVTAKEQDATIAGSDDLLVVAIARARNTGMKVYNDSRLLNRGTATVVMEPVSARIAITKSGSPTVHILDHDGCRTGRTLPVKDGKFEIDGARDKTCYYLVAYERSSE
jgi:hypothetical protein